MAEFHATDLTYLVSPETRQQGGTISHDTFQELMDAPYVVPYTEFNRLPQTENNAATNIGPPVNVYQDQLDALTRAFHRDVEQANTAQSLYFKSSYKQNAFISKELKEEIRKLIRETLESEGYILGRAPDEPSGFENLFESGGSAR